MGKAIESDIEKWRRDVEGYNPMADSGEVSSFDKLWHNVLTKIGKRKSISQKEKRAMEIFLEHNFPDYLMAYLLDRTLQEVRLELEQEKG